MAKTLPLSEVKTRLPELVTGVQEREELVVVTKKGRPAAILMNVDEYTRLKETAGTRRAPKVSGTPLSHRLCCRSENTNHLPDGCRSSSAWI